MILWGAPLFFSDNPYANVGNNPVSNVDPSGQQYALSHGSGVKVVSHSGDARLIDQQEYHPTHNGSFKNQILDSSFGSKA